MHLTAKLKKNLFVLWKTPKNNLPSLLMPEKTEWSLGINVEYRLDMNPVGKRCRIGGKTHSGEKLKKRCKKIFSKKK